MAPYKKSLGQHILQNAGAARRIVDALELSDGDSVLEIGPGRGALTSLLSSMRVAVTAIEVDMDMADRLRAKFEDCSNVKIVTQDILEFELDSLDRKAEWKIVGNLPYNITSPILAKVFRSYRLFREGVFTVQKEVADRMIAKPGTAAYSSLSVFTQTYASAERLFVLKPGSFFPPPKVSSAVVRLVFRESTPLDDSQLEDFSRFVQGIFSQRRKTLLNVLCHITERDKAHVMDRLKRLGIDPSSRPQDIPLDDYVAVFGEFEGAGNE